MADPITGSTAQVRQLMPSLEVSARGMSVQQAFVDVIARNIANAETTRLPDGGPYQRRIATAGGGLGGPAAQIQVDETPGPLVYDPGHPDADDQGFVRYPNVDVQTEVVDLMVARRMYEANATVFQAAKKMLKRALDI